LSDNLGTEVERLLQNLLFDSGAEGGLAGVGASGVLAVEGEGGGGDFLAGVELEVQEAAREDRDVALLQSGRPEFVLGVHEANEELAFLDGQDLRRALVPVGDVQAAGSEVETGPRDPLQNPIHNIRSSISLNKLALFPQTKSKL